MGLFADLIRRDNLVGLALLSGYEEAQMDRGGRYIGFSANIVVFFQRHVFVNARLGNRYFIYCKKDDYEERISSSAGYLVFGSYCFFIRLSPGGKANVEDE